MISLKNLIFQYDNKEILNDANFTFCKNKLYFIVGKNGVGKSTLFKLLNGEEKKQSGDIKIDGTVYLHKQSPIFFQDMTVKENVESFIELLEVKVNYKDIEKEYDLEKISNVVTGKLSGGEKQKLYLAITSLNKDNIILLDEADSALDPDSRKFYYEDVLKQYVRKGKTVLVISHNISEILNYAEGICFFKDKKLFNIDINNLPENIRDLNEKMILDTLEGMCV